MCPSFHQCSAAALLAASLATLDHCFHTEYLHQQQHFNTYNVVLCATVVIYNYTRDRKHLINLIFIHHKGQIWKKDKQSEYILSLTHAETLANRIVTIKILSNWLSYNVRPCIRYLQVGTGKWRLQFVSYYKSVIYTSPTCNLPIEMWVFSEKLIPIIRIVLQSFLHAYIDLAVLFGDALQSVIFKQDFLRRLGLSECHFCHN